MKVFKFGGASVKSAAAVRNIVGIVGDYPDDDLIIVISAMGKSTNALEKYHNSCYHHKADAAEHLEQLKRYHLDIIDEGCGIGRSLGEYPFTRWSVAADGVSEYASLQTVVVHLVLDLHEEVLEERVGAEAAGDCE